MNKNNHYFNNILKTADTIAMIRRRMAFKDYAMLLIKKVTKR